MGNASVRSKLRGSSTLWFAVGVLGLAVIGSALASALDVHGFGRGMLLGAALALLVLGGIFLGFTISKSRRHTENEWLPSRDGRAHREDNAHRDDDGAS